MTQTPSITPAAGRNRIHTILFWIALVVLCALPAIIWPGDSTWICDEPLFVGRAARYDRIPSQILGIHLPFTIATRGVLSSRMVFYGPLPVWIYQAMLVVTHNALTLVSIHAAVMTLATSLSMYWLARNLGLTRWLIPVALISPWFWFYDRVLWDNPFAIPIAALLLAAYTSFLKYRGRRRLLLAVLSAVALPITHLMSLAIVIPFFAHLILLEWKWVWRFKFGVALIVIATLALPYWRDLANHLRTSPSPSGSMIDGAIFPLLGAHHLSAIGIGNLLASPDNWFDQVGDPTSIFLALATGISGLIYVACWIGMILSIPVALKTLKSPTNAGVAQHITLLCLGVWIAQAVLDAAARAYGYPHYYNATWIVYILFAWWAIERLAPKFRIFLLSIQALSLATVTIIMVLFIHTNGGTRSLGYGTVLSNQMKVEQKMEHYSDDSHFIFEYPIWQQFDWNPLALYELRGSPSPAGLPKRTIVVRYIDSDGPDAHIELQEYPFETSELP